MKLKKTTAESIQIWTDPFNHNNIWVFDTLTEKSWWFSGGTSLRRILKEVTK